MWDNKYAVKDTSTGQVIPIFVAVTTDGPFNQKVQVHAGPGRADMLNWYTGDSGVVNAHEVGHMMGLYDEYIGGAVDKYPLKKWQAIKSSSIQSQEPAASVAESIP